MSRVTDRHNGDLLWGALEATYEQLEKPEWARHECLDFQDLNGGWVYKKPPGYFAATGIFYVRAHVDAQELDRAAEAWVDACEAALDATADAEIFFRDELGEGDYHPEKSPAYDAMMDAVDKAIEHANRLCDLFQEEIRQAELALA
jgi:hypothetical protein